jgi:hypothetical protein
MSTETKKIKMQNRKILTACTETFQMCDNNQRKKIHRQNNEAKNKTTKQKQKMKEVKLLVKQSKCVTDHATQNKFH